MRLLLGALLDFLVERGGEAVVLFGNGLLQLLAQAVEADGVDGDDEAAGVGREPRALSAEQLLLDEQRYPGERAEQQGRWYG